MNFPDQLLIPQRIIKHALLCGERLTTGEANRLATTVDARKCISRLRSEGMPISDEWVIERGRRFKRYFYNPEKATT